jgi:hypothetical protein
MIFTSVFSEGEKADPPMRIVPCNLLEWYELSHKKGVKIYLAHIKKASRPARGLCGSMEKPYAVRCFPSHPCNRSAKYGCLRVGNFRLGSIEFTGTRDFSVERGRKEGLTHPGVSPIYKFDDAPPASAQRIAAALKSSKRRPISLANVRLRTPATEDGADRAAQERRLDSMSDFVAGVLTHRIVAHKHNSDYKIGLTGFEPATCRRRLPPPRGRPRYPATR